MDRLVQYIASFDPAFPSRIEGASATEIERLERAAKGPLPSDYRTFLELMGRRDDAILGSDDIDTSADTLAEYYDEAVASGELDVPPDSIVFAISGLSIEELFIERSPPHAVFQAASATGRRLWAASFRGLLYQQAFERSGRSAHTAMFFSRDPSPRRSDAARLLDDLGLERLWFSDDVTLCYESPDDKILFRQIAGNSAKLQLSSRRLTRLWRLSLRFSRTLDLPLLPEPRVTSSR